VIERELLRFLFRKKSFSDSDLNQFSEGARPTVFTDIDARFGFGPYMRESFQSAADIFRVSEADDDDRNCDRQNYSPKCQCANS